MDPRPITVGELTAYIQDLFAADEVLNDLWIEGEVIESVTSRAGHVFFTFADEGCKLPCVVFRGAALRSSYVPVPGQTCAAHGNVSIYAREGRYQLSVDFVRPAGIGLAALEFELLKQQLSAEGLFELTRKRAIPERLRTIGVVTSPDGAVWHDIANVVTRRDPFVHLMLSPAAVQGDGAPESLRQALGLLLDDGRPDVIIICRGGGSVSDLSAFNDEALVRDAFASPIPIVSAVGHETDWTLLDLVADVRAATPSAAAELCTVPVKNTAQLMASALDRLRSGIVRTIGENMLRVNELSDGLARGGPAVRLPELKSEVGALSGELQRVMGSSLLELDMRLDLANTELLGHTERLMRSFTHLHTINRSLLDVLNPLATLARGYATLTDTKTGVPVVSVLGLTSGQHLTAHVHDGQICGIVDSVHQG